MFLDIGYLAHLREPGGTEIELVQRTLGPPGSATPPAQDRRQAPDQLGLVTLRVSDRRRFETFLGQGLGMSLLATMAVDHGGPDPFDLSFWSFVTPEEAGRPNRDPASVGNRPWLYQLPLTLIELQHHRTPVALQLHSPLAEIRVDVGAATRSHSWSPGSRPSGCTLAVGRTGPSRSGHPTGTGSPPPSLAQRTTGRGRNERTAGGW